MAESGDINQIGTIPKWKKIVILFVVILVVAATLDWVASNKERGKQGNSMPDNQTYLDDGSLNQANPDNYALVLDLAMHGDYQSQRNIAYGFSASNDRPYKGQEKNKVLGCAWYLVVLNSGSPKVNAGDQGNVDTYCGKLEPDLLSAAKYNARNFLEKIDQNTKLGKLN